jgi:hypothetical protein
MSYRVTYEYEAPDPSGLPGTRTGKMTTQRKEGARYLPGRPVTVVYDPEKPWRSVVYALGEYRAGQAGTDGPWGAGPVSSG